MVSVFKWQLRNTNVDTEDTEGIEICGKRDYLVSFSVHQENLLFETGK